MTASRDTSSDMQPPQVFISYASRDVARAEALHARLVAAGVTVWFDEARLAPGCDWHRDIEAACEAARVIVPLVTPQWQHSQWTKFETYGSDAVIPILAEGTPETVLPAPLRRFNAHVLDPLIADEAAWVPVVDAIRAKLAVPPQERAPRVVNLPHPANPFFIGRDADLVRIHEELHEAPVAALTQGRVRALAAMGGVGKTTLANEYARRFWRLYRQILWVDARLGLEAGFAMLFDTLWPGRAGPELKQDDRARLVREELDGQLERLLVLDNVEDAESVRPWLPDGAVTGCRTLITSRFADWPAAAGIRTIALYVLEPEPARQFLVTRTGRAAEGTERTACDDLARALGYLPLALEQAGAYMAAPGSGVDLAGYLRLYWAAAADLLSRGALGSTHYPDPVITTWHTTLEKLSPESRAVLRLCAWYADTPIPRELVMGGAKDIFALAARFGGTTTPENPEATELRLRDALVGLARYSMILDATDTTFRVHALVQAVERARAEAERRDVAERDAAIERLEVFFPKDGFDIAVWPLCSVLLPHIDILAQRIGDAGTGLVLASLLNRAGEFLVKSGDARRAQILLKRALGGRERALGTTHPSTLTSVNNLAFCLQALGDAAGALPLYRRALDGRERVLGATHPDTLQSVNNLALCLQALGNAAGALPLNRHALDGGERVLGATHPATLDSVNNLAACLKALGDAAGALPHFRRALDGRERVLGATHPDTLGSVTNLALCLQALGDTADALPFQRRALDGYEHVLGATHPATLQSVNNLAFCLDALGDAAGALPLYRRALDERERVLGATHPDTLRSVNNLAACLQEQGDAAGALPLHRRALDGQVRVLGTTHPDTLTSVNNLAGCLEALGDAGGALPLYRRALDDRERVLGATHPATLTSLNNLAFCLEALGDAAGALPLYRRALDGRERVLGATHPDTLQSVNNLAVCLKALGNAVGALPLYRRALDGRERVLGATHPDTLRSVNNLASCLEALGDAAGALPLYRRALDERERVLGATHPDTLRSVNNLAVCLQALGNAVGALPLYRRALDGRERVLGATHPDTLRSVNDLAFCLEALGQFAEAETLRRRASAS